MKFELSEHEATRLHELKDRFRIVANRRWGLSIDQRAELIGRASYDLYIFARGLIINHGMTAMPVVQDIKTFLTDKHSGASKLIEITMRPRPEEERLPFMPAEVLKRQCSKVAEETVNSIIYGTDFV